ncbi:hypothetical protein E2C01_055482 [Portunus trituberculatus]|uniref:Uncharacterized protein n=1 Tax=Portunus trituberculatus TaxID=210409 RepID=A0A5B7GMJ7_PORTR|nr:hypothetical protein [Portunus trituberculatus]
MDPAQRRLRYFLCPFGFIRFESTVVVQAAKIYRFILMSPGVVLCGYHRRGNWPVFLKKAQDSKLPGGMGSWTPEATRSVGR